MTRYRLREYGSAEWTDITLDGELEEFVGECLIACLSPNESLHVQRWSEETGSWENVE